MPTPTRFHIQVRRPETAGDPGEIAEGHYVFSDGVVTLTDERGEPLPGGTWNAEIQDGKSPSIIARSLLRQQLDVGRRARSFGRRLNYPKVYV
jgi:hypothetical protein